MSRLWTKEEVETLIKSYEKGITPKEISKKINRSTGAIKNKAYHMKITTRLVLYTDEEIKYIEDNYENMNLEELAQNIGRGDNYQNVCRKAKELGLTDSDRSKVLHTKKPIYRNVVQGNETIPNSARGGTRKDLGYYLRSRWEANFARYLNLLVETGDIYKFEYEPDTFVLDMGDKRNWTYTPDFKVWEEKGDTPKYIEVKGYMDGKSKEKLHFMKINYPDIKVVLFMEREYRKLSENYSHINNWEEDRYDRRPSNYNRVKKGSFIDRIIFPVESRLTIS